MYKHTAPIVVLQPNSLVTERDILSQLSEPLPSLAYFPDRCPCDCIFTTYSSVDLLSGTYVSTHLPPLFSTNVCVLAHAPSSSLQAPYKSNWHSAPHTRQLASAPHTRQLAFRLAYTSIGTRLAYTSIGIPPRTHVNCIYVNWFRPRVHVNRFSPRIHVKLAQVPNTRHICSDSAPLHPIVVTAPHLVVS